MSNSSLLTSGNSDHNEDDVGSNDTDDSDGWQ